MGKEYYSIGSREALEELGSSKNGLDNAEAGRRLEKFGLNEIEAQDRRTWASILLAQFKSPLILILVGASAIAFFLGEQTDALIIVAIVMVNAVLGFFQEFKSEKALAELRKYVSFKASVLRDGKKAEINVKELVPGDIVFLGIGDIVPADLRLIEAKELAVNESVITGESFPVHKVAEAVQLQKALPSQQKNIAFMGTTVSNGSGTGVVIATGKGTLFGRTATVLSAKEPPTDFQKNIKNFGNFLLKVILVLTVFVFASNAMLGKGVLPSFLFALALAVGITPELLPIIITIALSSSAVHLAKKKVVVKRLVTIEDLGDIDILCIDKTGTLTDNKVSLADFSDADGVKSAQVLERALVCNSAIVNENGVEGNPIDVAIWEHAGKKERAEAESYKKLEEIGFDYERRRMSVVAEKSGKTFLFCKGAPESVLGACSFIQKRGKLQPIGKFRERLLQRFEGMSQRGSRVIAIASKEIAPKKKYSAADETGLAFNGFLSFLDPPKETAMRSLKSFQSLGVQLKVLTGDNELVTGEVCREVGFAIKNTIVLGSELEAMEEPEFLNTVGENNVFARVTPEQKLKIVAALGKKGHIVGFLGDGVNDAPALKAADVGITVDSAVDTAKDSADIILLNKSLLIIADGIREGRKTFGNIMKYIFNTISANFGNMLTLAISSLFLKFIPLLPSQILLANLISDGPLMTISTDNVDEDYLHKPKRWNIRTISNFMVFFGIISMVFDFATIGVLLVLARANEPLFRTAWFLESVLSEIIVTFAIRTKKGFWKSHPSKMLVYSSIAAIALTVALIYSPFAFLFEFEHLAIPILASIGLILLLYFQAVELTKKRFYRIHEPRHAEAGAMASAKKKLGGFLHLRWAQ